MLYCQGIFEIIFYFNKLNNHISYMPLALYNIYNDQIPFAQNGAVLLDILFFCKKQFIISAPLTVTFCIDRLFIIR